MAERVVVQWQNSYSVGIRLVDEQHKELIRLTNRLFANCLADREQSRKVFVEIIREAVDYVGYHFSTEEKLMERVNYPEYAEHKAQHVDFVREVYTRVEEFSAGKLRTPLTFVYFLRDWVLHHIAVCDKKMGQYLLDLSRSGELQKLTLRVKRDEHTDRMQLR
ncbi:MAG: bacteriohemerythrin [Treponema sp.]|nr:bacteriohemerythrin [Treponema sp.]